MARLSAVKNANIGRNMFFIRNFYLVFFQFLYNNYYVKSLPKFLNIDYINKLIKNINSNVKFLVIIPYYLVVILKSGIHLNFYY